MFFIRAYHNPGDLSNLSWCFWGRKRREIKYRISADLDLTFTEGEGTIVLKI